jgi:hypothetical protein
LVDFGLAHALFEPLELKLTIHQAFVSGLPVGEFVIAGPEGDISRAFRLHTSWRLLGPWARSTCEGPAQCPDPSWRKPTPGRTDRPSRSATPAGYDSRASRANLRGDHCAPANQRDR